jgi:hypothetical protein
MEFTSTSGRHMIEKASRHLSADHLRGLAHCPEWLSELKTNHAMLQAVLSSMDAQLSQLVSCKFKGFMGHFKFTKLAGVLASVGRDVCTGPCADFLWLSKIEGLVRHDSELMAGFKLYELGYKCASTAGRIEHVRSVIKRLS